MKFIWTIFIIAALIALCQAQGFNGYGNPGRGGFQGNGYGNQGRGGYYDNRGPGGYDNQGYGNQGGQGRFGPGGLDISFG